jgi:protein-tyrosine phosphatase
MERREARNKFISRKKFSVLRQKVVLFCRHEVHNIYTFGLHLAGSVNSFMNTAFTQLTEWMSNPKRGFSAATAQEHYVFGACRPGFPLSRVSSVLLHRWIAFMQAQGIKRVVCLLPPRQLAAYDDLLGTYRQLFGEHNVLWAPIADFHLAEEVQLVDQIVPFLAEAEQQQAKTVVHCSGGVGRTGHVLAAWLVSKRGMSNEEAIMAVQRQGRNARESGDKRLDELLDRCRTAFSS